MDSALGSNIPHYNHSAIGIVTAAACNFLLNGLIACVLGCHLIFPISDAFPEWAIQLQCGVGDWCSEASLWGRKGSNCQLEFVVREVGIFKLEFSQTGGSRGSWGEGVGGGRTVIDGMGKV